MIVSGSLNFPRLKPVSVKVRARSHWEVRGAVGGPKWWPLLVWTMCARVWSMANSPDLGLLAASLLRLIIGEFIVLQSWISNNLHIHTTLFCTVVLGYSFNFFTYIGKQDFLIWDIKFKKNIFSNKSVTISLKEQGYDFFLLLTCSIENTSEKRSTHLNGTMLLCSPDS